MSVCSVVCVRRSCCHVGNRLPPHRTAALLQDFFRAHCVDWVASADPLDTPQVPLRAADMMDIDMDAPEPDPIRCVSAGHTRHEYTSGIAIDSVFKFLRAKAAATA